MKILVCGFGSIGKKHANNLRIMGMDIKIWRSRPDKKQDVLDSGFGFEADLEEGLQWCDAVVIATSTDQHILPALRAAKHKKPYYIEKPLSHDEKGIMELLDASQGLVVEVGCQLRQHPNFKALKNHIEDGADGRVLAFQAWVGQRLDEWRPGTDYRECYSADAKRGGGALFDLVHEIDLIHWLAGPVKSVYADLRHNSHLELQTEDLANLILETQDGACGTIQLDILSPAYRRGLQIICEKAVFTHDMMTGTLTSSEKQETEILAQTDEDYAPASMLFDAMEHFIARIKDPALKPSCTLEEGIHDLQILLTARKASKTHAKEKLKELS